MPVARNPAFGGVQVNLRGLFVPSVLYVVLEQKKAAWKAAFFCGSYRPVRAKECTQPCMRDFALAMSLLLKKLLRSTLSTA